MKPDDVALRKRSQIAKANRTMLMWIAIASVIVGSAVVVGIFMAQKLFYNEKVMAVKADTVSTLDHNNSIIGDLEDQIRVLDTNENLASVKANENDQAIQVILDALPSDANSLALGASLQNKLLAGIAGLQLESLQVDPVAGVETLNDSSSSSDNGDNSINFQFVVSGSDTALKQVLLNLERSIRTIQVTSLKIEIQSKGPIMTVQAKAFYEPAKTIQLEDKVVKP